MDAKLARHDPFYVLSFVVLEARTHLDSAGATSSYFRVRAGRHEGPAQLTHKPTWRYDSNEHRIVMLRTGAEMIKAHPNQAGQEQISKQFNAYVPADIPRPLPTGYYGHLAKYLFADIRAEDAASGHAGDDVADWAGVVELLGALRQRGRGTVTGAMYFARRHRLYHRGSGGGLFILDSTWASRC